VKTEKSDYAQKVFLAISEKNYLFYRLEFIVRYLADGYKPLDLSRE